DGTGVSWGQIAVRTTVFYVPNLLASVALFFVEPMYKVSEHWTIDLPRTASLTLAFVMFFATARRRNGWTGLHYVLSRTRVIALPAAAERHAVAVQQPAASAPLAPNARRYGPFVAIEQGDHGPGAV